jgi:hypothetical protein
LETHVTVLAVDVTVEPGKPIVVLSTTVLVVEVDASNGICNTLVEVVSVTDVVLETAVSGKFS